MIGPVVYVKAKQNKTKQNKTNKQQTNKQKTIRGESVGTSLVYTAGGTVMSKILFCSHGKNNSSILSFVLPVILNMMSRLFPRKIKSSTSENGELVCRAFRARTVLACSVYREKNEKQTVITVMGLGVNHGHTYRKTGKESMTGSGFTAKERHAVIYMIVFFTSISIIKIWGFKDVQPNRRVAHESSGLTPGAVAM